jgi:hypothetical protein
MSEKSTLLPTQPVHNVNETTTSQKVAAGLALFCAGTTVGLAWRYVQYTITGGGMNWGSKVWGYHPLLMTLAFGAFICGSLVYRLPEDSLEPRRRKAVHGTCHFAALVFGTVGLIAVWRSHGLAASTADGANLYSMHGWFGFPFACSRSRSPRQPSASLAPVWRPTPTAPRRCSRTGPSAGRCSCSGRARS